jgi:hypothetical protein
MNFVGFKNMSNIITGQHDLKEECDSMQDYLPSQERILQLPMEQPVWS